MACTGALAPFHPYKRALNEVLCLFSKTPHLPKSLDSEMPIGCYIIIRGATGEPLVQLPDNLAGV
jgi:hypothetical protein